MTELVSCSLSAAKRKRSKRLSVANGSDERKTLPCSPQGLIHHAAIHRLTASLMSWKYRGFEQRGTHETSEGSTQRAEAYAKSTECQKP